MSFEHNPSDEDREACDNGLMVEEIKSLQAQLAAANAEAERQRQKIVNLIAGGAWKTGPHQFDDLSAYLDTKDATIAAQAAEIERLTKELAFERESNVRMPIKRVEQTTPRNCGQACLAMIFDVPIDDVPKEASAEFWDEHVVQEWLSRLGLQQVRVRCFDQSIYPAYDVRCIVDGKSPRGEKLHAVVATMQGPQGWVLDADPHPDNNGIADEPFSASFFALKNPAEYLIKDAELAKLREQGEEMRKKLDGATRFEFPSANKFYRSVIMSKNDIGQWGVAQIGSGVHWYDEKFATQEEAMAFVAANWLKGEG